MVPVQHKPGSLELGNRACIFTVKVISSWEKNQRGMLDLPLPGTLGSRVGVFWGGDVLVLKFLFTCCQILVKKNRSVTETH